MPNKEDFDLPNQDVPSIDIPDLKKKEKERKKAGAAWGNAKPAGGRLAGGAAGEGAVVGEGAIAEQAAVGGARAAASAARAAAAAARGAGAAAEAGLQAGAGAQAGFFANLFAQVGRVIAGFTSTLLGKVAAVAVVALMVGGAAVVAMKLLGVGAAGGAAPDLGDISSNLKVHRDGGDTGLDYAAKAGQGQLKWENTGKGKDTEAGKTGVAEKADAGKAAEKSDKADAAVAAGGPRDRMAHDLSGSKLTSSLGGSSGFGSHDIFGGKGGVVPNFGASAGGMSKFGTPTAKSGKAGTMTRRASTGSRNMNLRGLKANRALAQLRGMAPYNAQIRTSPTTEANSQAAQTQFEGSQLINSTPPTSPTDTSTSGGGGPGGGPSVNPPVNPPYDPTIERCNYEAGEYWNGSTCVSSNLGGTNVTPWQGLVDSAHSMMNTAIAMLVLSTVMWAIADAWFATACSSFLGLLFVALAMIFALMAMIMGIMMIVMANQIASMGGSPQDKILNITGAVIIATSLLAMCGGAYVGVSVIFTAIGALGAVIMGAIMK